VNPENERKTEENGTDLSGMAAMAAGMMPTPDAEEYLEKLREIKFKSGVNS
jgi:hypothetical protein